MNTYDDYIGSLVKQFWDYVYSQPDAYLELLDSANRDKKRPPVFNKSEVAHNILTAPDATPDHQIAVETTLPRKERHRYFGSMRSSQALAQSVFGNLIAMEKASVLSSLESDEGLPAFFDDIGNATLQLEFSVDHLGEPRPTSIDLWVKGSRRVAVECKLTEPDFGTCSRPRLRANKDANCERDYCDGSYTCQQGRNSRCSLTEIGVRYWSYIPQILSWESTTDMRPCPLKDTYQLIRNALAACVTRHGEVDMENAHVLVIYDARNPAFQEGGKGNQQWIAAKSALKDQGNMRSCSWQRLTSHIAKDSELGWLVSELDNKYGFGLK